MAATIQEHQIMNWTDSPKDLKVGGYLNTTTHGTNIQICLQELYGGNPPDTWKAVSDNKEYILSRIKAYFGQKIEILRPKSSSGIDTRPSDLYVVQDNGPSDLVINQKLLITPGGILDTADKTKTVVINTATGDGLTITTAQRNAFNTLPRDQLTSISIPYIIGDITCTLDASGNYDIKIPLHGGNNCDITFDRRSFDPISGHANTKYFEGNDVKNNIMKELLTNPKFISSKLDCNKYILMKLIGDALQVIWLLYIITYAEDNAIVIPFNRGNTVVCTTDTLVLTRCVLAKAGCVHTEANGKTTYSLPSSDAQDFLINQSFIKTISDRVTKNNYSVIKIMEDILAKPMISGRWVNGLPWEQAKFSEAKGILEKLIIRLKGFTNDLDIQLRKMVTDLEGARQLAERSTFLNPFVLKSDEFYYTVNSVISILKGGDITFKAKQFTPTYLSRVQAGGSLSTRQIQYYSSALAVLLSIICAFNPSLTSIITNYSAIFRILDAIVILNPIIVPDSPIINRIKQFIQGTNKKSKDYSTILENETPAAATADIIRIIGEIDIEIRDNDKIRDIKTPIPTFKKIITRSAAKILEDEQKIKITPEIRTSPRLHAATERYEHIFIKNSDYIRDETSGFLFCFIREFVPEIFTYAKQVFQAVELAEKKFNDRINLSDYIYIGDTDDIRYPEGLLNSIFKEGDYRWNSNDVFISDIKKDYSDIRSTLGPVSGWVGSTRKSYRITKLALIYANFFIEKYPRLLTTQWKYIKSGIKFVDRDFFSNKSLKVFLDRYDSLVHPPEEVLLSPPPPPPADGLRRRAGRAASPAARPAEPVLPRPSSKKTQGGGGIDEDELKEIMDYATDMAIYLYELDYSLMSTAAYYPDKPIDSFLMEKFQLLTGFINPLETEEDYLLIQHYTEDLKRVEVVKENYDKIHSIVIRLLEEPSNKDTPGNPPINTSAAAASPSPQPQTTSVLKQKQLSKDTMYLHNTLYTHLLQSAAHAAPSPTAEAAGGSRFRNLKYTRKTRRKQRKTRTTRVRRSKRDSKK